MSKREYFTDRTGKWVGSVLNESGGKKTYFDSKGNVSARVFDKKTFDKSGKLIGNGDQGQRTFK